MESKEKRFSLIDSLEFGFETAFRNFGFMLLVGLLRTLFAVSVPLLIAFISFFPVVPEFTKFLEVLSPKWDLLLFSLIFGVIPFLFYQFMQLGYNKIELNLYDHKPKKVSDLFSQYRLILRAVGGAFLYILGSFLGFMFFLIPGIIFSITYGFYQLVMIDENVGITEAFKRSACITKGARDLLFALALVAILIYSITLQTFPIAAIFIGPALTLAEKYAYRKLKEQADRQNDTLRS